MATLDTEDELARALEMLSSGDERLAAVYETIGLPPLRRRPVGFEGLARIVVGQQVSTAAADSIWNRLAGSVPELSPPVIAACRGADLRGAGLSRAKVRTLHALCGAIDSGELDLAGLAGLEAAEAHGQLCALPGIGPWTADIYLMFCIGHADIFPAGDLALQHAIAALDDLEARPDTREAARIAERWSPHRAAAATLLWAHYRHLRGREGISS